MVTEEQTAAIVAAHDEMVAAKRRLENALNEAYAGKTVRYRHGRGWAVGVVYSTDGNGYILIHHRVTNHAHRIFFKDVFVMEVSK